MKIRLNVLFICHLSDGTVYEGGQTIHVTAPLEQIPVFISEDGPDLVEGWKKIREEQGIC